MSNEYGRLFMTCQPNEDSAMTFLTTDPKAFFMCPHCNAEQEEAIENYVVPHIIGEASRDHDICVNCDEMFSVMFDGAFYIVAEE